MAEGQRSEAAGDAAGWELLPHDADVGVLGRGPTPAVAFEQAGLALTAILTTAPVGEDTAVEVRFESADIKILFVDWLNAIIYEMAVR